MQKKLLTLAVAGALAAPVAAIAQVTLYGVIDPGIRNQSKVVTATGTDSVLLVTGGQRTTNRYGIKGGEDLGGGLMADFTLEGQYASDTGASATSVGFAGIFNRRSVFGLSKGGNRIGVGLEYTTNFYSQAIYEPMSYTYTGIVLTIPNNVAGVRSANTVTADFRFGTGGIKIDYAAGEVVGENSWGTRTGFMGDFAFGPVTVTGAFSTMKDAATGTISTDTTNLGAVYKMGAFTFRGGWSNTEVENTSETPMFVLGVQYAISPTLNGRVGYYNLSLENAAGVEVGTNKLTMVALDYYLSKRSTAYVAFDRRSLSGTAAPGTVGSLADGATGISVGITHSF